MQVTELIRPIAEEKLFHNINNNPTIQIINDDCLSVLKTLSDNSISSIVTDPPYGIKEYEPEELEKRNNGSGGVWRIPPSFDGSIRAPLPRFTAINKKERNDIFEYFHEFSIIAIQKMLPGAHVFIACNSYLSQLVYSAFIKAGFEFRTEIIRLVQTLRGGDRPKNAEIEFSDVCSMPRGSYEPWGLFRKPLPEKMTVAECLRRYGTGGLRRKIDGSQFADVIFSERTPRREREIANHPSLKPQSFLRQIVYSSLPMGKGIVFDPFMGSGSTLAAALNVGYNAIGIERDSVFFNIAKQSIVPLSNVLIRDKMANELFLDIQAL